jgi:hypothetical protein
VATIAAVAEVAAVIKLVITAVLAAVVVIVLPVVVQVHKHQAEQNQPVQLPMEITEAQEPQSAKAVLVEVVLVQQGPVLIALTEPRAEVGLQLLLVVLLRSMLVAVAAVAVIAEVATAEVDWAVAAMAEHRLLMQPMAQ